MPVHIQALGCQEIEISWQGAQVLTSIYHLKLQGGEFVKPEKEAKIGESHLRVSVVMSEKET